MIVLLVIGGLLLAAVVVAVVALRGPIGFVAPDIKMEHESYKTAVAYRARRPLVRHVHGTGRDIHLRFRRRKMARLAQQAWLAAHK